MPAQLLRTVVIVAALSLSAGAAAASERSHHGAGSDRGPDASSWFSDMRVPFRPGLTRRAARTPAADRHRDPQAGYKADRLSSSRGETILDTPGQTTVLTRQVLDDMKATSLRDAMRSTAGVTIGR